MPTVQLEEVKAEKPSKEDRSKIFKQHMEIVKLKEELQNITLEKSTLEDEIKTKNQELYQANERVIFLEF